MWRAVPAILFFSALYAAELIRETIQEANDHPGTYRAVMEMSGNALANDVSKEYCEQFARMNMAMDGISVNCINTAPR